MKKYIKITAILLLLGACTQQNICEKNKEKVLDDIGAEIYYIEHRPLERLKNKEDSAMLRWHRRNYEVIFSRECEK